MEFRHSCDESTASTYGVSRENRMAHGEQHVEAQKESPDVRQSTHADVMYIGYLGFAGNIPWTIILVFLPILETVLGGATFAYAVGIAMGLACNLIRFLVVIYGRRFTFKLRIIFGAVCSAMFTIGYSAIYLLSTPLSMEESKTTNAVEHAGFWIGLALALIGGAGNAQLLSTGYGLASLVSVDIPVANNLFFMGQAVAAATCWPLKRAAEALSSDLTVQLAWVMPFISLVALSVIPVYLFRILRNPRLRVTPDSPKGTLQWSKAKRILTQTFLPIICMWTTYFVTNLVTPGQLMNWLPPMAKEAGSPELLSDPAMYRSLCSYVNLLADALSKAIPVVIALDPERMRRFLRSKSIVWVVCALVIARIGLLPLFFFPPAGAAARFILLVAFGGMNGCAASFALSLVSFIVDPEDSDLAGYICSFVIINGLFIGSLGGMLIKVVSF